MIKNIALIEHKIGERSYKFLCDNDAPLGEVHDALAKFKSHIVAMIQESDKSKEESKKVEDNEQCPNSNN